MARPLHYERWYGEMEAALRDWPPPAGPGWRSTSGASTSRSRSRTSILAALYGARLMNVFERRGDMVAMSAVSDLVNGWPGGIIQASRHGVFVTPIYLVNSLYAAHLGATRLAAEVDGPTFSSTREGSQIPVLDVSASRSADGQRIFIKAVNTDLERPLQTRIRVRGANISSDAVVKRVVADSLAAVNGFATPNAVSTTGDPIRAGNSFSVELPRHSVSVITLAIAK